MTERYFYTDKTKTKTARVKSDSGFEKFKREFPDYIEIDGQGNEINNRAGTPMPQSSPVSQPPYSIPSLPSIQPEDNNQYLYPKTGKDEQRDQLFEQIRDTFNTGRKAVEKEADDMSAARGLMPSATGTQAGTAWTIANENAKITDPQKLISAAIEKNIPYIQKRIFSQLPYTEEYKGVMSAYKYQLNNIYANLQSEKNTGGKINLATSVKQLQEQTNNRINQIALDQLNKTVSDIQNRIIKEEYVDKNKINNSAEYIIREGIRNSIFGKLKEWADFAGTSGMQRQIYDQIAAEYDPSWLTQGAAGAVGLMADAPLFAFGGGIGAAAGKPLVNAATRQIAKGIATRGGGAVVPEVATQMAGKAFLPQVISAASRTSGALATYDTVNDILNQQKAIQTGQQESYDPLQTLTAAGKGAATGAIIGPLGAGTSKLTSLTTSKIAKGAIGIGGFSAENAVFVGSGAVLSGEPFTPEAFLNSALTLGLLRLQHITTATLKERMAPPHERFGGTNYNAERAFNIQKNETFFTPEERADLERHGVDKNDFVEGIAQIAKNPETFSQVLADPNVAASSKIKLMYALTGKQINSLPYITRINTREESGKHIVETFDNEMTLIERKIFNDEADAKKYEKRMLEIATDQTVMMKEQLAGKEGVLAATEKVKNISKLSDTGLEEIFRKDPSKRTAGERAVVETYSEALSEVLQGRQSERQQPQELNASETSEQPLTEPQAAQLISTMEQNAVEAPVLELTPENWEAEFGEDGKVQTPLGEAKMGDNQYRKIIKSGRQKEFGMIKPTLTNPDIILEVPSEAIEGQETERPSSYLFVKTFKYGEETIKFFTSVTVSKQGLEVVISNHIENLPRMRGFVRNGKLLYQRPDMVPGAEASDPASTGQSTEAVNSAGASDSKATNNSEINKKNIAQKIISGSQDWTPEELQYYKNNPQEVESELIASSSHSSGTIIIAADTEGNQYFVKDGDPNNPAGTIIAINAQTGESKQMSPQGLQFKEIPEEQYRKLGEQYMQQSQPPTYKQGDKVIIDEVEYTLEEPSDEQGKWLARPGNGIVYEINEKDFQPNAAQVVPNAAQVSPMSQQSPLTEPQAAQLISTMEQNAVEAPVLELTPENWEAEFGEDGIVQTPLGEAKMGDNQYIKMAEKGRQVEFGMVKPTLTNPDIVIEEASRGNAVINERETNLLFIKTFDIDGKKFRHFESVTVSQDKKEVVVSNHIIKANQLLNKLKAGRVVYIATALEASGQASAEYTSQAESGALSSDSKDINNSGNNQENEVEKIISAAPKQKNGNVDFNALIDQDPAAFAVLWESRSSTEDAKKQLQRVTKNIADDIQKKQKSLGGLTDFNKIAETEDAIKQLQTKKQQLDEVIAARYPEQQAEQPEIRDEENYAAKKETSALVGADAGGTRNDGKGTANIPDLQTKEAQEAVSAPADVRPQSVAKEETYAKKLYADAIINGEFHKVTETPNEDTVYELLLKSPSDKTAKVTVYTPAKERVFMRPEFLDGSTVQELSAQPTDLIVEKGEVSLQPSGKWHITKEASILFVDKQAGAWLTTTPKSAGAPRFQAIGEQAMAAEATLEAVNTRFNEELQQQIDGTLPKGHVYKIGNPSDALLSNLDNFPIEMAATTLETKSSSEYKSQHPFDLKDIQNLPQAIQQPIAVFESETNPNRTVVLTELKNSKGNNFIAILDIAKERGRNVNTINSIISLYPKESSVHIAKWFLGSQSKDVERDLLKWVDTKKALNWLADNTSNVRSVGLSTKSIANIIQNFQNPKLSGENSHISDKKLTPISRKEAEALINLLEKSGLARSVIINEAAMREYLDRRSRVKARLQVIEQQNKRQIAEEKLKEAEKRGYIDTGITNESGEKIVIIPKYTVSWFYADNTNPEVSEYKSYDEAIKALDEAGYMEDVNEYFTPYNQARILFDIGVLDEYGEVDISKEDIYMYEINRNYVPDFIHDIIEEYSEDTIGTNFITNPAEEARELEKKVYLDINNDVIKEYDGYTIEIPFTSKYRDIDISDKDGNLVDTIQLRIADHPYNPANNNPDAKSGKFISVEVFEKDKTRGRFNGRYSLQFSGNDSYEDIVDAVNERIMEIIDENIDSYETQSLSTQDGAERFMMLWHGSPHFFNKFSLSKMGTGEGNQAFGPGLYFTDNKDIAKYYATQLSTPQYVLMYKGKEASDIEKAAHNMFSLHGATSIAEATKIAKEAKKSFKGDKDVEKAYDDIISVLQKSNIKDFSEVNINEGVLYNVNVSDNINFIDWYEELTEGQKDAIISGIERLPDYNEETGDGIDSMDKEYVIRTIRENELTGNKVQGTLEYLLGNGNDAAYMKFMRDVGILGVKYPSDSLGDRKSDSTNYVIFDENITDIVDKIRLMATRNGEALGFVTPEGVVYLDPNRMNANTPFHEFGHLWNDFVKKNNPELWAKITALTKETPYFKDLLSNPAYANLKDDDARVDEAFAQAMGDEGERIFNDPKMGETFKERFRQLLKDFWAWIGKKLGIRDLSPEQISKLNFRQAVRGAVADITSGKPITFKDVVDKMTQPKSKENLQNPQKNNNFAENNNVHNDKGTETNSERPPLVGRPEARRGIYQTIEASNLAGSIDTIREIEEREELESRGINPDWNKVAFRRELEKQAEQNGVLLDKSYLDDKELKHDHQIAATTENDVYLNPDGKTLTKVNNLSQVKGTDHKRNLKAFIDRLEAHNVLFPEVAYDVKGFIKNKRGFISLAMEQPYIDAERNATQEEIDKYLSDRGFWLEGKNSKHWTNGKYIIEDARPANVLKGKDGRLYFIDTIPHSVEYMSAERATESTGARFQITPKQAPKFTGDLFDFAQRLSVWNADRTDNKNEKIGALSRDQILSDYRKIMQALSAQKSDFQQSGNAIAEFVRTLIDNQTFDEMGRAQMNQIITQVKNAATKIDILSNAKKIFDIVLDKQIKVSEKTLDKYLNLKVRGKDQRGVAVGKLVDDNARIIVEAVKQHYQSPLTDIEARLLELEDTAIEETDAGKVEKIHNEIIGLNIAKRYHTLVSEARKEIQQIEAEISGEQKKIDGNQEKKIDRNGKTYRVAKTGKGSEIKQSRETISALEDELRTRKEDLRKGLDWISVEMSGVIETGKTAKKQSEEARLEHKKEVLRGAFFDLADVAPKIYEKKTGKTFMQKVWDGIKSPLPSFNYELRKLGRNAIDGEGYTFSHFAPKIIKAINEEFKGRQQAIAMLDEKANELFGMSAEKVMNDISNTDSGIAIEAINPFTKEAETIELTIGNATYIYMVNKMADTKVNLLEMGISEEDVENIAERLPENIIRFADWMQEEFYPKLREKYNKTYEQQYGIQMANMPFYVPKEILTGTVKTEEDITDEGAIALPTILAGSLISRKRNKRPIDIVNTDFIDLAFGHINEMEYWNSFIGITEDINTLLSSPRFKTKLENIHKGETATFRKAAQIAVGAYSPTRNALDDYTSLITKTYAKSKIAFRLNTAAKQILSLPAFATEGAPVIIGYMTKNMANPYGSWKWAMENLPTFEKRVKSRLAGNEKLDMSEEKMNKIIKGLNKLSDIGMYPNMFIDALTVAVGARSVYEYKKSKYEKMGYAEEVSEEKALIDAAISLNETQQSAEGMFLAPIQRNRDLFSNAISVYNNNNIGYQRKVAIAAVNIQRYLARRDKMISFRTKQLVNDGFDEEKAKEQARQDIDESFYKSSAQLIMNGYILQWIWRFGLYGLGSLAMALITGDEKKMKEVGKQSKDASIGALVTPVRGLVGGSTLESIIDQQLRGASYGSVISGIHPFLSDAEKYLKLFWQSINKDDYALLVYSVASFAGGITGMNLDTISNVSAALVDLATTNKDLSPQQIILDLSIIANLPNSQTKEMAEALRNGRHGDFIKEYIKWRNKYGLLYPLRKSKR